MDKPRTQAWDRSLSPALRRESIHRQLDLGLGTIIPVVWATQSVVKSFLMAN
jgi:hypothetical protein